MTDRVALTIAGSDPSGGAGIQADLKTFTALGVYGGAVISCLTVQNTRGVYGIEPVEAGLIRQQIDCVLDDLNVSHIKIGMLGSAVVVGTVAQALRDYRGEIIYDPVLVSSSGRKLVEPKGLEAIHRRLLPFCTVLTPNVPELAALTGKDCSTRDGLLEAAAGLFLPEARLRVVIVTGGHFETHSDTVTDFMLKNSSGLSEISCEDISHPRITSNNTHGTGCTFSAAFTAYHLRTTDDSDSFRKSVSYMDRLIRNSASMKIGHGTGPLVHHLK